MKVLFTTFSYYPETSGVPIVVQYLAEGLAQKGHEVTVATRLNGHDFPKEETVNSVRIVRFDMGQTLFKTDVGDCKGYIDFVINTPKDVLILECVQCHTTDILLPYLKEMKCKIIIHSHGGPGVSMKPFGWEGDLIHSIGHTHNWMRWKRYYKKTLPAVSPYVNASILLSLCASDMPFFSSQFNNVQILGNAANSLFFDEGKAQKDVSDIIEINNKKYIVCIANYIPNKGQLSIVDAFSKMKNNDYALVLIGSKKNDYYSKVKEKANSISKNRGKEILVLDGIERDNFPAIIKGASLFVMASLHEEYPVSLVEAMAMGTPFLSTNAGCSRILPGGVTVNSREELPYYMELMCNDEILLQQLGERGYEYARKNCTVDSVVSKLENIIIKS